jgi:hypothetical protein
MVLNSPFDIAALEAMRHASNRLPSATTTARFNVKRHTIMPDCKEQESERYKN